MKYLSRKISIPTCFHAQQINAFGELPSWNSSLCGKETFFEKLNRNSPSLIKKRKKTQGGAYYVFIDSQARSVIVLWPKMTWSPTCLLRSSGPFSKTLYLTHHISASTVADKAQVQAHLTNIVHTGSMASSKMVSLPMDIRPNTN